MAEAAEVPWKGQHWGREDRAFVVAECPTCVQLGKAPVYQMA